MILTTFKNLSTLIESNFSKKNQFLEQNLLMSSLLFLGK
ncbi:hypothetical protein C414_000040076 [Campylobacter jejuni subsp. jejuni 414]|nr:hypothetical protein C414_000040076 [Campylobacter jejuni subsp. jejuni 414]